MLDASHWYWRRRLAQLDHASSAIDLSKIHLLFIGDSIIERWDQDVFTRQYGHLQPLNLGISGDTTQGLLWRLPRSGLGQSLHPALIILLIGANNIYQGGNAEAVAIGIGDTVRFVRRLSPASRILLLGILPRGPDPTNGVRLEGDAINRLIARCADNRFVFYADPGISLAGPGEGVTPELEADALHPTARGYAILSHALDSEISQLLR